MEQRSIYLSIEDQKIISSIVDIVLASHSMNPSTVSNMISKVEKCGLFIVYNRFSFTVYKHNLNIDQFNLFMNQLSNLANKHMDKETLKARLEYAALISYINNASHSYIKGDLLNAIIIKTVRPDFEIVSNDNRYGIEVVRLTTEYDQIGFRISDVISGTQNVKDAKKASINKFGAKANNYEYVTINSEPKLMTKLTTTPYKNKRQEFAKKVFDKYEKYKNQIDDYKGFMILCDASDEYALTHLDDVKELLDFIKKHYYEKEFCVSILFINEKNHFEIYEEVI